MTYSNIKTTISKIAIFLPTQSKKPDIPQHTRGTAPRNFPVTRSRALVTINNMSLNKHHVTDTKDRLPISQKVAYGLGGIVPIALANIVFMLIGIIGNIGLGISLLMLNLVMMVPRIWDAFTDPLMGHISDNTRSRHGRRRPYILWGGIAVCVTFVIMWWIPKGDDSSVFVQLMFILALVSLFYTAVTIFEIPHGALGMEMTDDYHERTRLFSFKSFIGNIGAMATPWLYMLAQLSFFKGAGGNEADGMKPVSIIVALFVLPCILICYSVCREGKLEQAKKQKKISFKDNFKVTFKNKVFLLLVCVVFLTIMGFHFVGNFANYITIFYLYSGNKILASKLMGITGTVWAITSLAAIFPMNWLSSRMGKSKTLMISILLMAGAQLTKIVCYNPQYPYLILIPTAMLSAGMVMYFTLASAMVADVCDEDELHTGLRSEGAYYSIFWWFMKIGMAAAGVVAGIILMLCRFDEKQSSMVDSFTSPIKKLVSLAGESVIENEINYKIITIAVVLIISGIVILFKIIREKKKLFFVKLCVAILLLASGIFLSVPEFRDKQSKFVQEKKNTITIDTVLITNNLYRSIISTDKLIAHFTEKKPVGNAEHYEKLLSSVKKIKVNLNSMVAQAEKEMLSNKDILLQGESIIRQSLSVSHQSNKSMFLLRVFEICIPVLLCLISLITLKYYPLSENRMYEIKAELERRKNGV